MAVICPDQRPLAAKQPHQSRKWPKHDCDIHSPAVLYEPSEKTAVRARLCHSQSQSQSHRDVNGGRNDAADTDASATDC
ncbi:hypothetical protein CDD82_4633 [Ophiocordyceps australis]|uniref:Uncharacterized protein n=1 Tax=Ophiocordyceps australis TaxID=1399860 RepID=A0A2C5Z5M5_9HYPO|nr:hypothetical protein CDD82_4633 [Ophiocordyceps australis]